MRSLIASVLQIIVAIGATAIVVKTDMDPEAYMFGGVAAGIGVYLHFVSKGK